MRDLFGNPIREASVSDQRPKIVLRDYQQEAVDAVFKEFANGIKSTLVTLPTGCGKSVVFSAVIERYRKEYGS